MSTSSEPLTLELFALPKEVPVLRRTVREHLGGPCAEVQLCVSEILGNVIRHVGEGTPVVVHISGMRRRPYPGGGHGPRSAGAPRTAAGHQ